MSLPRRETRDRRRGPARGGRGGPGVAEHEAPHGVPDGRYASDRRGDRAAGRRRRGRAAAGYQGCADPRDGARGASRGAVGRRHPRRGCACRGDRRHRHGIADGRDARGGRCGPPPNDWPKLVQTVRHSRRCYGIIMQNSAGTPAVDTVGARFAAFGCVGPLAAALVDVSSERALIANAARLLPGLVRDRNAQRLAISSSSGGFRPP